MVRLFEKIFDMFGEFVFRDLFYIVGGLSVIASLLYYLNYLNDFLASSFCQMPLLVYIIVVSHVVGYALQELFSFFPLVSTGYIKPEKLIVFILHRFTGSPKEEWENMPATYIQPWNDFKMKAGPEIKRTMQRTVNLLQIGSIMSSSIFVSWVFLMLSKPWKVTPKSSILLISLFILGVVLVIINRVKNAQMNKMLQDFSKQQTLTVSAKV